MIKKYFIIYLLFNIFIFAKSNIELSEFDNRIGKVYYNPNDTVTVYAKKGYMAILEFEEGEHIISGWTAFNDGWNIKKSGNIAYIFPKDYISSFARKKGEDGGIVQKKILVPMNNEAWKTNFFIKTNKRLYVGDLVLSDTKVSYKIQFKYGKQKNKENEEALKKRKKSAKKKKIERALAREAVPKNWNFFKKVNRRSRNITPNYVYDDGKFTYFGFDRSKKMPSIFLRDGEDEYICNSHVKRRGRYYVKIVHTTGKLFFLRSGKKLVGILNRGYNSNPLLEYFTTSNKKVKRRIK